MPKTKKKRKNPASRLTKDIDAIKKSLTRGQREELAFYIEYPEFEQVPARDFSQFINDPYYLGIGEDTWEKVKEEGDKIWGKYWSGEINEAILLWGIGSGKSYLASGLSLQYVQQLLCMENPHKSFGITNDKPICVVNMGPTATQAKNVVFSGMKKLIESSPFFAQFSPDILSTEIRFPQKNISLYCGNSKETMPIGMNVILGVMDEAAWYIDTEQKSIAEDIFNTLSNRIASRFGDRGLMIIISAPRYIDDFITLHYNQAQDLEKVYASSYKTWEVKNREVMSEETFDFIVSTDKHGKPTETWKGIPMDFKTSAERNPERFMRDFGARPSLVLEPFDKDAQIIIREAKNRGIPIDKHGRIGDWFKTESDEPRYIHIDLGLKKDACGIAMGHKMKDIEIDGEKLPYIYIDLVHRIQPKPGEQIQFSEVRQLIYTLQDRGFNIQKVTLDQYQSVDTLQILNEKGIMAEIQSVDRDTQAYETLKEALHQKRFDCYPYEQLHKEYQRLELVKGKKVDHPPGGCFVGNTKIALLDGRNITLKEAIKELGVGKDLWIYSVDKLEKKIVPAKIGKIWETKRVNKVIEIVLDNNEKIGCTLDHRFMLRGGEYKEAKDIVVGESLMPLYTKVIQKGGLEGYRLIYDIFEHRWRVEHKYFTGKVNRGFVVHHRNFNKLDNHPPNLAIVSRGEHRKLHNNLTKDYGKVSIAVKEWHRRNKDSVAYKRRNEKLREWALSQVHPQWTKLGLTKRLVRCFRKGIRRAGGQEYLERLRRERISVYLKEAHKDGKYKNAEIALRRYNEKMRGQRRSLKDLKAIREGIERRDAKRLVLNHKIKSVKVIETNNIPVYDLEVQGNDNFALACGVFVHNSKDVSDAVAGVCKLIAEEHEMEPFIFVL